MISILGTPSPSTKTGGPVEVPVARSGTPWVESDWGEISIGGNRVYGIAEVTPKCGIKIDEKEAPGVNGSTVTIQGRKMHKFEIIIRFGYYDVVDGSTPETQFTSVVTMLKSILPSKETAKPLAVSHPVFDLYGVREVLVTEWSGPEMKSDLWEVKLDCMQYRKPSPPAKPATTTPDATDSVGRPTGYDRALSTVTGPVGTPPLSSAERSSLSDATRATR